MGSAATDPGKRGNPAGTPSQMRPHSVSVWVAVTGLLAGALVSPDTPGPDATGDAWSVGAAVDGSVEPHAARSTSTASQTGGSQATGPRGHAFESSPGHGRTPSPPSDGVLRPGVAAHQRSGGSAPTIAVECAAEIVPCPQAPRRRKELDRRRLDRDDRGEEDEDQEHRHHHRETAPERGHDDRSERAIEADGGVHAGETPK